jgi:hypothetical protein
MKDSVDLSLYKSFNEIFSKINNRNKLLSKYKKMDKIMKPGNGKKALSFFYKLRRDEIDDYLDENKPDVKIKLVESLNEFKQGGDPYKIMGLGERRDNTSGLKVLKYIRRQGEHGASFTEIQKYWWTVIAGRTEESFYKRSPHGDNIRQSRGYQSYYLGAHHAGNRQGLLPKWCEKNDAGRWVLKRFPKVGQPLKDFDKPGKVYEFKQGGNPYDTMSIGSNRPFKKGDKLRCKQDLWWHQHTDWTNDGHYFTPGWEPWFSKDVTYILKERKPKIGYTSEEGLWEMVTDDGRDAVLNDEELKKYFIRI